MSVPTATRPTFPERPAELRLELQGRLTHAVVSELRSTLASAAARRPRRLVLDLREVVFLDATVVGVLRALERRVAAAGGGLLVQTQGSVARTLALLGAGHLVVERPWNRESGDARGRARPRA